ncbi:MAG: CbtB-domain containing protein [Alphaproteobacteria bacterium]|nr:CbtB-domain containing protein [Alphaproteobacteria bacterium]MCZ6740528.1 CbtB-domain containing protein [Alphaproteobacteria bacterium]MCZ6849905.1 CbtB-domain containing protein [Alphaproteobacteria bacterium]
MGMSLNEDSKAGAWARTHSQHLSAGLIAVLLGSFLLLGTGFAHSDLLHDAAHDVRHGFTFPCH